MTSLSSSDSNFARREQARLAWSNFVDTRVESEGTVLSPSQVQDLEYELDLAEESAARVKRLVARAKRLRNQSTWPAQFPVELLERIFLCVRDTWKPRAVHWSMRSDDRYIQDSVPYHWCGYEFGWINITFVCSLWREVAINFLALWNRIDCSTLDKRWRDVFVERSNSRTESMDPQLPLHYQLTIHSRPARLEASAWTKFWLTESIGSRLRSLHLNKVQRSDALAVLNGLPSFPGLIDLSVRLSVRSMRSTADGEPSQWEPMEMPARLPAFKSCRLSRVAFNRIFPPIASPIFSPAITHLQLEAFRWTGLHPFIPSVETLLNLLRRLSRLETLLLRGVPRPREILDLEEPTLPLRSDDPLILPPSLKDFKYKVAEESWGIPVTLDFLSRITLPMGADIYIELGRRYDDTNQPNDAGHAMVARAAALAVSKEGSNPWRLKITGWAVGMVFSRETHFSQGVNPRYRSLDSTNNVTCGDTHIIVDRDQTSRRGSDDTFSSDSSVSQLVQELPMEDLEYLELSSVIARVCFTAEGVLCTELLAARAVRHLALRVGDHTKLLPLLNCLSEVRTEGDSSTATRLFPKLEALTLHCLQYHAVVDAQFGAALATVVRSRQEYATPSQKLFRVFVSERLRHSVDWETLSLGPHLTFFEYGDFDTDSFTFVGL
ncbi:hypothetical protein PENSPDRAFT_669336 [Peniophora sp. CONT]|nr:hypothetical protein PENSPDRAFT_669336 [Peniophora sp. CONT]